MRIVYSSESVRDLVRLRTFIEENNPAAAARVAAELVSRIDQLCLFPQMGHVVDKAPVPGAIRDFVFGSYIVRYAVGSDAVIILRVWHHYESRA